ncbi:MAG: glutamine synthetase [Actinobacteria bacterium]|nr:glutamine synthetase [Actinomycetota bacterium]
MDQQQLARAVDSGEVDTVVLAFTDMYGRMLGKRLDADFFLDDIGAGTHACNYLLTTDIEMEPVPGYEYASWELGYGDFHLVPDFGTMRQVAWAERTVVVLCDVIDDAKNAPVAIAPRSMLRRQIERGADLGFTVKAASELEFYLYDDSYRDAQAKGHTDLTAAGWYNEDYNLLQGARIEGYVGAARRALSASGIPVESSKGEAGRGQHELNIRYADVLDMADRHTLMKQGMKELADQMGVSVTFMAKPHANQSGNSSHLHLSLWNADASTNVFAASPTSGDGSGRSDTFRHFLGGWMAHTADFTAFYAPTVNSYKRYRDGSWAPTRIAWSDDNRTAGFRVVGSGPSLRIECRIPGADCNPYLAYTAALASGLDGIENRTEPPEAFRGDVYAAADLPRVAYTLEHAAAGFRSSSAIRGLLGDAVVDHYSHFFGVEVGAYNNSVTDWELNRYFERI